MTEESLLQAVQELIAIESTADNPAELRRALDFIAAMIWQACPDATIERFERGGKPSLLAYRGGTERPKQFHIMLNGHLDVVPGKPEQFHPVIKDSKLYGRGVYDMKAACVVLTHLFCEYVNRVPYTLGLQIVTDEESAGRDGTLYQIEQGVRADFIISGESGRHIGAYEIANEAKGVVIVDVGFHGRSAHSAYPWKGDNAILRTLRFIEKLHQKYPVPTEPSGETLVSVTAISGDSGAHSKLPDYTTVKLAVRYTADDPDFASQHDFIAAIKNLDPDAEIIAIHDFSSPIYTDPKNPLLLMLKTSAEKVEEHAFSFVRRHGTGDGRFYGDVGNQACEFGIVGDDSHGDNEYITLKAFDNYLKTMRDFLEKTVTSEQGGTDA